MSAQSSYIEFLSYFSLKKKSCDCSFFEKKLNILIGKLGTRYIYFFILLNFKLITTYTYYIVT
jgi:hypothetical protein